MKANHIDRFAPIFIGIVIISYGVAGPYLWPFYQTIIETIITGEALTDLVSLFNGKESQERDLYNLGIYLIYYPSYVVLHLGLVSVLFRNAPQSRFIGIMIILIGLPLIASITFLFYLFNLFFLYEIGIGVFKTFVGMPFILFLVEGGRLIDLDIDKLIREKSDRASDAH